MRHTDGYYTVQEVARIFGVSEMTIRRWVSRGIIKHVKIMRTVRIPEEEVERLKRGE